MVKDCPKPQKPWMVEIEIQNSHHGNQKPGSDLMPQRKYQQQFIVSTMVSKWCERISSFHSMTLSPESCPPSCVLGVYLDIDKFRETHTHRHGSTFNWDDEANTGGCFLPSHVISLLQKNMFCQS